MQTILTRHYRQHVYPHILPQPYVKQKENELLLLPFFHVYGFGALISCLLNGSTGVVMAKFEQDLFCRTVQDYKVAQTDLKYLKNLKFTN
jgi:acyl-CoA synthetase (AMP-forming)/AMP-acid ligase II